MARKTPPEVKAARITYHDALAAFYDAWNTTCVRAESAGLNTVEAANAYCAADAFLAPFRVEMERAKAAFAEARRAHSC